MSSNVMGSSSGGSGSETYSTFNADMEMNMDNRSMDLNDNMVTSMDENNSNINGSNTNLSPRSQDNMFGGVEPESTRTTFSVDVPPFKSQLTNSFSQSDIGKVFNSDNSYATSNDMDSFSGVSDVGQGYGQGFTSSESGNSYSQVFSSGTNSGVSYSQTFASSSETYSGNQSEVGVSFAQSNLNNMMQLKGNGAEKNICTVSKLCGCCVVLLLKTLFPVSY